MSIHSDETRLYLYALPRLHFLCHLLWSASTPVTALLVPAATKDALRLLLDDGVADTRAADATEESRAYDALRQPKLPSASAVEKLRAQSTTPGEVAVGTGPTGTVGVGEHHDRIGGERGTEPDLDGNLRWRLWHKGEVRIESAKGRRTSLAALFSRFLIVWPCLQMRAQPNFPLL